MLSNQCSCAQNLKNAWAEDELVFARQVEVVLLFRATRDQPDCIIMVEITIKLPEILALTFGATPEARSQRLAEDAAVEEYRAGRLSHRQVGEMLGLDYWQTDRFLTERRVPVNYGVGELDADLVTLKEILGSK